MRFIDSQMPRRKRKPKPTPLDEFESFLVLKSVILNEAVPGGWPSV